jgi:hypothetical protein
MADDPIVWVEDGDSRQATIVRKGRKAQSTYTKSYKLFGTADDVKLHTVINAEITANGKYWQYPGAPGMQLMAESYSVSFLGDNAWQLTINYTKDGAEDGTEPLKRARSFDTSGGTQHITQAHAETIFGGGPSYENAIGVDDNAVNGVDIVVPALQWQESYDVPNKYITNAYIKSVAGVTGTVNNSSFRGFAAGEVLFVGCAGSQEWDDDKGRGPWSLSYRFVASQNVTGQSVGTLSVNKKGHEYLWVVYKNENDSETVSMVKKPKYAYVNKVYRDGDFSSLGIGTS